MAVREDLLALGAVTRRLGLGLRGVGHGDSGECSKDEDGELHVEVGVLYVRCIGRKGKRLVIDLKTRVECVSLGEKRRGRVRIGSS
jgi:hypothetical protein